MFETRILGGVTMCMLTTAALINGLIAATVFFASATLAAEETKVDLEVGNVAPAFAGADEQGPEWKSSDHVGKKIVVVYFYPADFTGGCTKQAESWRDNMNSIVAKGVEVIGISGDAVLNHKLFKESWKLNFTLLADGEATIAKQFGACVVLKGCGTVVASASGEYSLCAAGNPGMATAGSGDVLSGIIVALLGQGLPCYEAAQAGVLAHAVAGDLTAETNGEIAMIAGDIIDYLPQVWKSADT